MGNSIKENEAFDHQQHQNPENTHFPNDNNNIYHLNDVTFNAAIASPTKGTDEVDLKHVLKNSHVEEAVKNTSKIELQSIPNHNKTQNNSLLDQNTYLESNNMLDMAGEWSINPITTFFTDIHAISDAQCGNFKIFLSLRFYVKSNLGVLEVQNLPVQQF